MWQCLHNLPWLPRSSLCKVQECQALGWLRRRRPEERRTAGCSKQTPALLQLADHKRVHVHQSPRLAQVHGMRGTRSRCSGMPLSTEGIAPSPLTIRGNGQGTWPVQAWKGDIPTFCGASQRVLTSEYHTLKRHTPLLIIPQLDPLLMYIVKVSRTNSQRGITSAPSPGANWNRPWALFSPPLCPLFQKC